MNHQKQLLTISVADFFIIISQYAPTIKPSLSNERSIFKQSFTIVSQLIGQPINQFAKLLIKHH